MVRNDWVWVWVRAVTMVIGDSLESYRRWLSATDWVFIGDSGVRLDGDKAQWTKA